MGAGRQSRNCFFTPPHDVFSAGVPEASVLELLLDPAPGGFLSGCAADDVAHIGHALIVGYPVDVTTGCENVTPGPRSRR